MVRFDPIRYLLISFVLVAPLLVAGQATTLLIDQGNKWAELNEHQKAIGIFKAVLERDENNITAQYKIAESYRAMLDYKTAESYYLRVKRRRDGRFLLAGYYYALMVKLNGNYQESLVQFEEFMALLKERDQHEDERFRTYYEQAKIEREGSLIALNEISSPQPQHGFSILSDDINSEQMDSAPTIFSDDSTIVISSGRGRSRGTGAFGENWNNFYRFTKQSGEWSEIKSKDNFKVVNDKFEDAAGNFNAERDKFYFTRCEPVSATAIDCKIYVTSLSGGEWSEPVALNSNINGRGSNSRQPSVTVSGDSLFFCSDRVGGVGGYDIYLSTKYGDENWGPAQHLGSQINTPFTESSPFYDHEDEALFFSSEGHRGFGGFDIYIAQGSPFEKAEIYNAGLPYNSNRDDLFFIEGEHKGYLSSNREDGVGKMDIYAFNIQSEKELITEIESDASIAGRNSLFSDDYDFDSDNDEMLSEIISHMMAANMTNVEMALTNEQLSFYNSLSKDDQERIDRIVSARVRNLSQNDLQAIRDEDEFFYSHMRSDDKRHVDNLISAYVKEDGLGLSVHVDQSEQDFYEGLSVEDKEKVDMIIATRMQQAHEYHYPTTTYDGLDDQSKQSVDLLSKKVVAEKRNIEDINLSFNENLFLRNNQDKPEVVNNSIKEKIYNLAEDPDYVLKQEDRIFYQNLDSKQLEALENIATSIILNDVDKLGDNISKEDLAVYNTFSGNQKAQLDRILTKLINNTVKADLYIGEANFEKDDIAEAKTNRNIEAAFTYLKQSKQDVFEGLEEKSERAIQRFIEVADPWIESTDNIYLPENEVQEPEFVVDRGPIISDVREGVTSIYGKTGGGSSQGNQQPGGTSTAKAPSIRIKDLSLYKNLSAEQKGAINRSIASDLVSAAYRENSSLPVSDNGFQADLSSQHKSFVQVLAKQLTGEPMTSADMVLLTSAQSYYGRLSGEEKATWSRIIAKEALKANRTGNEYTVSAGDLIVLEGLSATEKSAAENIKNYAIRTNGLIVSENAMPGTALVYDSTVAKLSEGIVDNFKQLNLNGTIKNTDDESPLAGVTINTVSNNGVVIQQTTTKADGGFLFTSIPNANYSIELADGTDGSSNAYLNTLAVKGTGGNPTNSRRPGDPITEEDITYYGGLDATKKLAFDLSIAAEILTEVYEQLPRQVAADEAFYESLTDKEESYIEILSRVARGEAIEESEYLLKAAAESYYAHLIPEEQPFWSRIIAKEALTEFQDGNKFVVSGEVKSIIDNLTYAEKNAYSRIKASRSLNEPFFANQLNADPSLLAKIPVAVTNGSDATTLTGQIAEVKTETPVTNQSVSLLTANNTTISTVNTDEKGNFSFNDISGGDYQLKATNTDSENLYVNQLSLQDEQGEVLVASSETSTKASKVGLEPNDETFYSNLNDNARKAIERSIAVELLNEAYRSDPTLAAKDDQYAQSLSETQSKYLSIIAKDMSGEPLTKSELEDLAVAYSYYKQIPQAEKEMMGRLITRRVYPDQASGEIALSTTDQEILAGLSSYEKGVYERIKQARKQTSPLAANSVVMDGSEDVLLTIPELTSGRGDQVEVSGTISTISANEPVNSASLTLADNDGDAISRTTSNSIGQFEFDRTDKQTLNVALSNDQASSTSEPVYVSDLSVREVSSQNILAANENSYDISPSPLSARTIATYQELPKSDQKSIDRLIALEYVNEAYSKNPAARKTDQEAYKDLTNLQQRYLKVLAMDLQGEELNAAEQDFLSSAYTYYYNVAPRTKATLNRIVADMIFDESQRGQSYSLNQSDANFQRRMSGPVTEAYDAIKEFRFNNQRILSEDLEVESGDLGQRPIVLNIPGYTNQEFSRLNITGTLIDTNTGSPVSTKALRVVDKNGNMVARTFTGSDGQFKFNEIRAGDYNVELEQGSSARTQNENYFVKDLEITGTKGSKFAYQRSFNIHFDFNGSDIRPEARQALFDVIEVADNQDIFIELRAHTDAIGNDRYNDELSGKRGISTMDFLKRYGIQEDQMSLLSYGKNDPVASNKDEYGRQFNRRVEVILKSQSPIRYFPPTVYLIRPKATLYSIAKNFNLTIEEIMKLNGLSEPTLSAYKPLRVLNPMNYRPDLDMLVELNTSVSTSNSFKYTVQSGETITTIAEKFNLPEELLFEMNDLSSLSVEEGKVLNIYVRF